MVVVPRSTATPYLFVVLVAENLSVKNLGSGAGAFFAAVGAQKNAISILAAHQSGAVRNCYLGAMRFQRYIMV